MQRGQNGEREKKGIRMEQRKKSRGKSCNLLSFMHLQGAKEGRKEEKKRKVSEIESKMNKSRKRMGHWFGSHFV